MGPTPSIAPWRLQLCSTPLLPRCCCSLTRFPARASRRLQLNTRPQPMAGRTCCWSRVTKVACGAMQQSRCHSRQWACAYQPTPLMSQRWSESSHCWSWSTQKPLPTSAAPSSATHLAAGQETLGGFEVVRHRMVTLVLLQPSRVTATSTSKAMQVSSRLGPKGFL